MLSSNLPRSILVANLYPVQLLENYTDFALCANTGLFKGDNPCSELNSLDPPPTSVDEQDQLWAMNATCKTQPIRGQADHSTQRSTECLYAEHGVAPLTGWCSDLPTDRDRLVVFVA